MDKRDGRTVQRPDYGIFIAGLKGSLEKVCRKLKQVLSSMSTDSLTRNRSAILTNRETAREQKAGCTSPGIKIGSVGALSPEPSPSLEIEVSVIAKYNEDF